ncbi:MAG: glycosyl hydrolase-related protein, partial [Kovacikia sp.]
PHAGDWKAAQTVQKGYELNTPLLAVSIPENPNPPAPTLPPISSLLNLGADNLVLIAFKQSEDSPNEWILRCYESHGEEAQLHLQSHLNLKLEGPVDLLERSIDSEPMPSVHGQIAPVYPWKIVSFKVSTYAEPGIAKIKF